MYRKVTRAFIVVDSSIFMYRRRVTADFVSSVVFIDAMIRIQEDLSTKFCELVHNLLVRGL